RRARVRSPLPRPRRPRLSPLPSTMDRRPVVVGVSGASGTPYAAAVLRGLLQAGCAVDLVVSRAARLTILDETGAPFRDAHWRDDLARWLGTDLAGADVA